MKTKIYDKETYRYGEVMDAQVTDNGESWALIRWDASPWYPEWVEVSGNRYVIRV